MTGAVSLAIAVAKLALLDIEVFKLDLIVHPFTQNVDRVTAVTAYFKLKWREKE